MKKPVLYYEVKVIELSGKLIDPPALETAFDYYECRTCHASQKGAELSAVSYLKKIQEFELEYQSPKLTVVPVLYLE